jgi:hypothetical protein
MAMTRRWKNQLVSYGSLLLFLFFIATDAFAGVNVWTRRDLEGRTIGSLGIDPFAHEIASAAVDIAVDQDGTTRLLFDTAGRLVLGTVDPFGQTVFGQPYGPYPGWTPRASAVGDDGVTRILWTHDDGSASLWLAGPLGAQAAFRYVGAAGLIATDVSAGPGSDTHILWKGSGGAALLQTINASGEIGRSLSFGPYTGWSAVAIADGPDGLTRLLWNHSDGRAGLSLVSSEGIITTARYESVAGSTAIDVAVGADGQSRILWTHDDGRMTLWRVDSAGNPTALGPIYTPPPGLTASRITTGHDSLTRVLWTGMNGTLVLWIMSADNVFRQSFTLAPILPPTALNIAGAWTGTYNSNDDIDCDTSLSLPAQASFQQNGSTVVGTLKATGPCGPDYRFQGTLLGNALSGGIDAAPIFYGSARGTLSGATLEITLANGYGYIMGQLHLHR